MSAQDTHDVVGTGVSKDGLFIPLIDFDQFLNGNEEQKRAAVTGIADGFKNSGFIYLKNHGIPLETIKNVFKTSAEFFRRPQAEKNALSWTIPEANRGYVAQGREKVVLSTEHTDLGLVEELRKTVPDLKETMEIGRDNHPVYKNNWPPGDVAFKEIMSSFFWTCQALQIQIMSALAVALGFENEYFTPFIDQGDNNLRILHYPPATAGIFDENQVRAGKHTDYGTITLLFQDSAGGLQVKSPGSTWVDVTPIPGTVVVNTGDLLNRWSNGLIASTQHQVVKPPTQPVDGMFPGRYSIAYFCNPNADVLIEALPGTFRDEADKKYPGIKACDYLLQALAKTITY